MSSKNQPQFCAMCAWREDCAKKFSVPDGSAHRPFFSRDITHNVDENADLQRYREQA